MIKRSFGPGLGRVGQGCTVVRVLFGDVLVLLVGSGTGTLSEMTVSGCRLSVVKH